MNNITYTKEQLEYFIQGISGILPECFRLHSRLLATADPKTHEINCSLNELAKLLNYNNYILFFYLYPLTELKFIQCPRIHDFDKKLKIKVRVRY